MDLWHDALEKVAETELFDQFQSKPHVTKSTAPFRSNFADVDFYPFRFRFIEK